MMICEAVDIHVHLDGRTLTVSHAYQNNDGRHETTWELDDVQAEQIVDQLSSRAAMITPDSIVGSWLQRAFNSGLDQGRLDAQEAFMANANLCGPAGSAHYCEQGCCGEQ